MFFKMRTTSFISILVLLFFQQNVFANSDDLIYLAGEQRMQVQVLAKDYFYAHGDVLARKTLKVLKQDYAVFEENNMKLKKIVIKTQHKGVVSLLELLEGKFSSFLKSKKYHRNTATALLEVTEDLEKIYDDIVKKELKDKIKKKEYQKFIFLDLLEQQAMVVEKLAKYYVAYSMGITDVSTLQSIKKSIKTFEANHRAIIKQKSKIPDGIKDFKRITKTWRTMKGYYAGIEESQLPAIALITTDRILKSLTNLINMYKKQEGI